MHAVGAPGEHELIVLAARVLANTASLVHDEPDAAAAVVFQLLPALAR